MQVGKSIIVSGRWPVAFWRWVIFSNYLGPASDPQADRPTGLQAGREAQKTRFWIQNKYGDNKLRTFEC